jgi:diguanylate cyclase (GGDEF)-like protein/PAS domain S-box-containing protein
MVLLLGLHALVIPAVAIALGAPIGHALLEALALAVPAALACLPTLGRRQRSALTTLGLMTSSALVVHVAGGITEAHFHFFIVLALISVYEDWVPFALAFAYVFVHHGILGAVEPEHVLAAHDGDNPWAWAAVHGIAIATAGVANIVAWQLNSDVRSDAKLGERRYQAVVEGVGQVIFQTDGDGRMTFLNPAWERLTGVPVEQAVGRPALDFVMPDERPRMAALLSLREGRMRVQVQHETADGDIRWFEVRGQPAAGGEGVFGTIADVTETRRSEEQLAQRALHDPLTGLPNRTLFHDRLDQALAAAHRGRDHVAVLFIDVDDFKRINDDRGHSAGDALLRDVAQALTSELRAGDTAARLGGDEFAVLCTGDADRDAATDIARRIHARFEHAETTVSVGVTAGTPDTSADMLLREADAAMYRAKAAGRNGIAVFDESMRSTATRLLRLEADLYGALDSGELELRFQPLIDLEHGVHGFETLLRWNHPRHGLLEPAEFLPVAEQSGAIIPIGEWVLAEATAWAAARSHDALPVHVAVNVSQRQLAHRQFVDRVDDALAASDLPAGLLLLEVGEAALGTDDRRVATAIDELHELGVQLVLDDFGTGASSLSSLKRFPIDLVKIDRSFVDGVLDDPSDQAIVEAIAGMATALGVGLAAEGVETDEQAARLKLLGCGMAQGRYFGEPMDAAVATAWLTRQRSAAGHTIR